MTDKESKKERGPVTERNVSFQRILWIAVGGLLTGLVIFIILLFVISRYNEFKDRAAAMRVDFVEQQKQMIKREVDRIIQRIEFKRSQIVPKAGILVKEQVREAHAVLENIRQKNAGTKSAGEIRQIIIDLLGQMRVYKGKGGFFILDLRGNIVSGNAEPGFKGSLPFLHDGQALLYPVSRRKKSGVQALAACEIEGAGEFRKKVGP